MRNRDGNVRFRGEAGCYRRGGLRNVAGRIATGIFAPYMVLFSSISPRPTRPTLRVPSFAKSQQLPFGKLYLELEDQIVARLHRHRATLRLAVFVSTGVSAPTISIRIRTSLDVLRQSEKLKFANFIYICRQNEIREKAQIRRCKSLRESTRVKFY